MRAQAHQIGLELGEPHGGRHVERLEGLLAQDAVDGEAVARLEAPHRGLDIGIEDVGDAGIGARDRRPRSAAGARP